MTKTLILVRHAKSDWSIAGQKDYDRTLNSRGHREAPRMGKILAEKNIKIDTLISSGAERAKLTAMYFAEQLKFDTDNIVLNDNLFEASARIWMNEVCDLDNKLNTVVMFGHNPGISYFIEYVCKSALDEIPTCAVVGIQFEIDSWKEVSSGTGKMIFYDIPSEKLEGLE